MFAMSGGDVNDSGKIEWKKKTEEREFCEFHGVKQSVFAVRPFSFV